MGVYQTVLPEPAGTVDVQAATTVPPLVLIWNSWANNVVVNFAVPRLAVNTSDSGCAPLTGEVGDGAVALRVDPSAAASPETFSVVPGETGVDDDLEHAIATASRAAAAQRTNLFWYIS